MRHAADRPRICAVIVRKEDVRALRRVEPLVDLVEVRIDMIGEGWQEVPKRLKLPWLATNRVANEGGQWQGDEASRTAELLKALDLGARYVDIELQTKNVRKIVETIRKKAKCIVSFHDWDKTPSLRKLETAVRRELAVGADICKITAKPLKFEDNATFLELLNRFPEVPMIATSFGPMGVIGRTLSPLMGGYLTYATIADGKGSAEGQISARSLRRIYDQIGPGVQTSLNH